MRHITLVFISLLFCSATVAEQQKASLALVAAGDKPMIAISNSHTSSIEAFLVTVDLVGTSKPLTRIYYDVHANFRHDSLIPPGASKQLPLMHIVGQELPVSTLRAVVFSDGTSMGDTSWVNDLLHHRNILMDRLQEVMELLQKISDENMPQAEAIEYLENTRQLRRQAAAGLRLEERVWNDQIFDMTIGNLKNSVPGSAAKQDPAVMTRSLLRFYSLWLADLRKAGGVPQGAPPA